MATKDKTGTKGKTTGASKGLRQHAAPLRGQQQQQPQPATGAATDTRGLGALSKRDQQNLGRWIGGVAQLLGKAGIDVPMSAAAA